MIYYEVNIVVKGSGGITIGKPNNLVVPKWHRYYEGGIVYKEVYEKGSPRIPHFLCFYSKRYIVEYHINDRLMSDILSPKDISNDRLRSTVKPIPCSIIKYNGERCFVTVDDNDEYHLSLFLADPLLIAEMDIINTL